MTVPVAEEVAPVWFYIYQERDGRLVSEATEVRLPLPAGLAYLQRESRAVPPEQWDAATRGFVTAQAAPDRDLVEEVISHPQFVGASLGSFARGRIRTALEDVLAAVRYQ